MGDILRLCVGQSPAELSTTTAIGDQIAARPELADWPTALTIATLAKAHNIAIHYGFAETDGNNTFNSAQCFGPMGCA